MSEEPWVSFWGNVVNTILTTLATLFAVFLTYWLTQTREKNKDFTKKVFEPLYTDILEIKDLARRFKIKRSSLGGGTKYSAEPTSKCLAPYLQR